MDKKEEINDKLINNSYFLYKKQTVFKEIKFMSCVGIFGNSINYKETKLMNKTYQMIIENKYDSNNVFVSFFFCK